MGVKTSLAAVILKVAGGRFSAGGRGVGEIRRVPKPGGEVGMRVGKGAVEDGEETGVEDVPLRREMMEGEGPEARLAVLGWRLPEKKKKEVAKVVATRMIRRRGARREILLDAG